MKVDFKIPYDQRSTSPAFVLTLFVLMLIALLIWFRG